VLITWIQRNIKTKEDAAIGIVFTFMFALGVMGISWLTRQEGVHLDLKDFLFGNILGISNLDLVLTSMITLFVILCVLIFYRFFFVSTFQPIVARTMGVPTAVIHYFLMLLLSFAVVASLQSVGVILVVAMLIIPASAAQLLTHKLYKMILVSAMLGFLSAVIGLLSAIYLSTTPGPAMTVCASAFYALAVVFSPSKGLLFRYLNKRKIRHQIMKEDVLKAMVRLHEDRDMTRPSLQARLDMSGFVLNKILRELEQANYIRQTKNELELTRQGTQLAYELIRKHRLWETFLVDRLGMKSDEIHMEAERLEHVLTDQIVDEVEQKLGYPKTDPHGSPIPQKAASYSQLLESLSEGEQAMVTTQQDEEYTALHLWKKGITPNTPFKLIKKETNHFVLEVEDKEIIIEQNLADQIKVVKLPTDHDQ
jgi:ABC-type Mn2+/Zn2+ transport system permease subunit/Mn-dependent DtxR family transcriptional regulator